jgi:two-component system, OmpR family, phosphate regulon sensor histidine kinase PhoR
MIATFWRVALLAIGGLVGWALSRWLPASWAVRELGILLGAAVGMLAGDAWGGWRLAQFLRWLRDPRNHGAPALSGLWAELAYRVERALRSRDEALSQQQQRLSQFLQGIEASPNGVLLLDGADQIEWCSAQSADHFSLDPIRDRQQRVTNLIRSPAFVAHLQAGRYSEPVLVSDLQRRRTLSVIVRPYGDGAKLVLSQDITDLERSDAMRRDFVANVSHEIRTPLTVVAGFIETLRSLDLGEPEREQALELMAQQTTRMQALVADLLQLAQLEGSPRPAPDNWLALELVMRRIEQDARALSAERHAFRVDAFGGIQLAGSEAEIFSALANLVSNAIRYTPAGGTIALSWQLREDGSGVLSVTDTGPGIAPEHLGRLTERFYRVDSSRSRDSGGTGLGLAIVKHVMQRHGGEILIESEPGSGSRFMLVWPPHRVRVDASRLIELAA